MEREKARNKTKKRNWKKKVADKKNLNFKAMLKIEELTGEVAELKKELNEQINQEHSS